MSECLKTFMVRLASDVEFLSAFIADPRSAMQRAELPEEDQATLLSGDQNRIYGALWQRPPEAAPAGQPAVAQPAVPAGAAGPAGAQQWAPWLQAWAQQWAPWLQAWASALSTGQPSGAPGSTPWVQVWAIPVGQAVPPAAATPPPQSPAGMPAAPPAHATGGDQATRPASTDPPPDGGATPDAPAAGQRRKRSRGSPEASESADGAPPELRDPTTPRAGE